MRRKFFVALFLCAAFLRPAFATTQLIVNGAFESPSPAPWVLQGAGVQYGYLVMGNADGQVQTAYQTVIFPTNLIAATLSLAYQIVSGDPNEDDTFTVNITDTNLNPLIDFGTITSASTTSGWVDLATNFISYTTANSLSSYAGRTVNVEFYVTTDSLFGYLTQFYVSDVSLVAATTADIPANDDFTNATVIPTAGITRDVTNTYASKEPGEPNHAGNAGGHSVWWTWTAPALGTVSIITAGSSFTTLLGVYTGSSVSDLTVVTNSDGINRVTGKAWVTFIVTPGAQYHIALDGYNGESGDAVFAFKYSHDTTPPTVSIHSPKPGADVSSSTLLVQGTASDNVAVAWVKYRLENAAGTNAWQLATGTNTWSAVVTDLIPGPNTVQVEAYDVVNLSNTVSRIFNYVIPIPLSLTINGEGTVSGATNRQLLNLTYPYKLTAKPAAGFKFTNWTGDIPTNTATLSFIMASNLSFTANFVDITKPTLSITAPVAGERWSNSVLTVTGKAKDNVGVASVWFQLNTEGWMPVLNTTNGWTNWDASVTPTPGANKIKAYAVDAAGNISPTNSVSFIYVPSAPLTVRTNGFGKFSPNYNNVLLAISNTYTMTATAGKGFIFSNWTANTAAVVTNGAILKFTMESNLDFTANFVPNPFPPAAGTYEGLFYNTNASGVAPAGSGFFSAQVHDDGTFTAKFQQGSKSYSVSSQFSPSGGWSSPALKTWGNTAISLQLALTGEKVLEGGLTNSAWVAALGANRAVFSKTNPAPQQGAYTLILPATNSGDGFGAVTVDVSGDVTFTGTLGDGTKVTQSAIESEQGQWV